MSAIASFSEFKALLENGTRSAVFNFGVGNIGTITGLLSTYRSYQGGAVPSVPVACYGNDPTALMYIPLTNSKQMWVGDMEFAYGNSGQGTKLAAVLYDRLVHSGGLVGNVITEQATNLPSAALPRYTDGVGVVPFMEVYTSLGTVATTATIKYTNQDGVPNCISKPVTVATNVNNGTDSLTPFPLADGDTGCRSVEGFTMAGAAAAAGSIGITLMRRIIALPVDTGSMVERQSYRQTFFAGSIAEIKPGAFLQLTTLCSTSGTGFHAFLGRIGIIEK